MASITIRNLDDNLKSRLRVRAAHHGRSMEDEVRDILRSVLASQTDTSHDLVASIRRRFANLEKFEFDIPHREPMREPPDFGSQFDAQIAAISFSRGAILSTRNVSDFSDCGVRIVNPWDY